MLGDFATALAGSSDIFAATRDPQRQLHRRPRRLHPRRPRRLPPQAQPGQRRAQPRRPRREPLLEQRRRRRRPTTPPSWPRARRDLRALLATLFASRGTIMLTAGDEFGRSQRGNNNAYAQDNAITWLDWERPRPRPRSLRRRPRRPPPRPPRASPTRRSSPARPAPTASPTSPGSPPAATAKTVADWEAARGPRPRHGARPRRRRPPGGALQPQRARGRLPPARPRPATHWPSAPHGRLTLGPRAVAFVAERPGGAPPTRRTTRRRPLSRAGRRRKSLRAPHETRAESGRTMDRRTLLHAALAGFLGSPPRRALVGPGRRPGRARAPSASTPSSPAPASRRPALRPAADEADRALRRPEVRPVPRHPLPRRQAPVRRRPAGFQMDLMPPGFSFQDKIEINLVSGRQSPSRSPSPPTSSTSTRTIFPYPDGRAPDGPRRRHGLQRPPLPLPDQPPRRLGRGRGVPGRELLPRRGPRHLSTASPPAASPSAPPARTRRSSRSSPPSGSRSRSPATACCA